MGMIQGCNSLAFQKHCSAQHTILIENVKRIQNFVSFANSEPCRPPKSNIWHWLHDRTWIVPSYTVSPGIQWVGSYRSPSPSSSIIRVSSYDHQSWNYSWIACSGFQRKRKKSRPGDINKFNVKNHAWWPIWQALILKVKPQGHLHIDKKGPIIKGWFYVEDRPSSRIICVKNWAAASP